MKNQFTICFLQYSLAGGGAERKVCTLANFFVQHGYAVEIGLFGRNIVAYELDQRVKLTFINRHSYAYKSKIDKLRYRFVSGVLNGCAHSIGAISKRAGKRFMAHFDKKYNYTLPIISYIKQRPNAVFISMTVQVYNEVMRIIEEDVRKGKIKNPYIVMECSNPTPGLDATETDDTRRNMFYPLASRVATMTQGIVECFNEDIQKKCVVIPNPIREDLPEPYHGERRNTVVNYGRLHPAKNFPLLIEAFRIFHSDHQEYKLEIYGQGALKEELERKIDDLGLSGCTAIYPFDPHIHDKIKDCSMFVCSSDWEGFPNSVLEALAIGLPTVSTDCDFGPRDMIEDHVNGLLTPVGDKEALAKAMAEIADNPSLAQRLSNEAVKVRSKYNVDIIGQQWLDLIEEVAKERGLA